MAVGKRAQPEYGATSGRSYIFGLISSLFCSLVWRLLTGCGRGGIRACDGGVRYVIGAAGRRAVDVGVCVWGRTASSVEKVDTALPSSSILLLHPHPAVALVSSQPSDTLAPLVRPPSVLGSVRPFPSKCMESLTFLHPTLRVFLAAGNVFARPQGLFPPSCVQERPHFVAPSRTSSCTAVVHVLLGE